MIATTDQASEEPARPAARKRRADGHQKLTPDSSGAPQFQVMFSRPADLAGRPESRPNSFRWAGTGTLHVLERGLVVIAKRRFSIGLHTTDERFVPASEICGVYREGNSVRVGLRGESPPGAFFQFWTGDAATAGTIVRLLPTTRTIEYEGFPHTSLQAVQTQPSYRRQPLTRAYLLIAVLVGFVAVACVLTGRRILHPQSATNPVRVAAAVPNVSAARPTVQPQHASEADIRAARARLERFDGRIDGLRAQYRTAFGALTYGTLSQEGFIVGVDKWLIPQWQALYAELMTNPSAPDSLDSAVRQRLIEAAVDWDQALGIYVTGLQEQNVAIVLDSFDRMSTANEAQRRAHELIDQALKATSPHP